MGIHVSPYTFMSIEKDRYLYNPGSFFIEGLFSHIEKSLKLFSGARHLIFAFHMINIYEASSGSFMTSLIFVKIKAHERMPFWEILVPWHLHWPFYVNVFRMLSGTLLGDLKWDVHYRFKSHKFRIHYYTLGIVSQSSFQGNQLYIWSNWIRTAYTVGTRQRQI